MDGFVQGIGKLKRHDLVKKRDAAQEEKCVDEKRNGILSLF